MKFLVDENLPPAIARYINNPSEGIEARHVNDFGNELPVSDNALRRFALQKNWILITRDDDFVKSYVTRKAPEKLIFVFGFQNRKQLLEAFEVRWTAISEIIHHHELIELNPEGIKVHF